MRSSRNPVLRYSIRVYQSDRASPTDTLTTLIHRGSKEAPSGSLPGGASPCPLDKLPYISVVFLIWLVWYLRRQQADAARKRHWANAEAQRRHWETVEAERQRQWAVAETEQRRRQWAAAEADWQRQRAIEEDERQRRRSADQLAKWPPGMTLKSDIAMIDGVLPQVAAQDAKWL